MTEINKIQCPICAEYIDAKTETCPFCGEKIKKEEEPKIETETSEQPNKESSSETAEEAKEEVKEETKGQEIQEPQKEENKKNKIITITALVLIILTFTAALGCTYYFIKKHNPQINIDNKTVEKPSKPLINNALTEGESKELKEAKEYFKNNNYDKSASILQNEIDKKDSPVAYYYMAEIYKERNYTNLAIKTYKKADSKKSNFFEAKKRLAQMYKAKYDYDQALAYAETANKINPKDLELLQTLVDIYTYLNKTDDAIKIHKQIVKMDPKNYDSNMVLAAHYYSQDNCRESIPYIKNVLDAEYNTNVAYKLAGCYTEIEYYTKAIEVLDLIIRNDYYESYRASYYKENIETLRQEYRLKHSN